MSPGAGDGAVPPASAHSAASPSRAMRAEAVRTKVPDTGRPETRALVQSLGRALADAAAPGPMRGPS
jgi:hypothetical protein